MLTFKTKLKLKKFQEEGADFLVRNKHCILSDPMGAGKSVQAIAALQVTGRKGLIVCPPYLRHNWGLEVEKFTDMSVEVFTKKTIPESKAQVCIIGYTQLENCKDLLKGRDIIVFDEIHFLKTPGSKRTTFAHRIVQELDFKYIWGLSGTPIKNRITEWYSLLSLISYKDKKWLNQRYNYYSFANEFSNKVEKRIRVFDRVSRKKISRTIVEYTGTRNIPKLKALLEGKYLRRKIDVLELPECIDIDYMVNYANASDTELEKEWAEFNATGKKNITAKKKSAILKASYTVSHIKNLLDQGNKPLLMYTCHPDVCKTVSSKMKAAKISTAIIDGSTPVDKRQPIVNDYEAGKIDVLCCTIGAASTGFTLIRGNTMVFNDLDYVPTENAQAKGRINRIGQNSQVQYHYILGSKIDQSIAKILRSKEKDINAAT